MQLLRIYLIFFSFSSGLFLIDCKVNFSFIKYMPIQEFTKHNYKNQKPQIRNFLELLDSVDTNRVANLLSQWALKYAKQMKKSILFTDKSLDDNDRSTIINDVIMYYIQNNCEKLREFNPDIGQFTTFFSAQILWKTNDFLRRERRHQHDELLDTLTTKDKQLDFLNAINVNAAIFEIPEELLDDVQTKWSIIQTAIKKCIERLEPNRQVIIIEHYYNKENLLDIVPLLYPIITKTQTYTAKTAAQQQIGICLEDRGISW